LGRQRRNDCGAYLFETRVSGHQSVALTCARAPSPHHGARPVRPHRPTVSGHAARSFFRRLTARDAASFLASVDAAPLNAIIGVAAQSVRLMNVVRVAVRIARIYEDPRQLARRKPARRLRRYLRKGSTLVLASRHGTSQRRAKRDLQTDRLFHWRLPCFELQRLVPINTSALDICCYFPEAPRAKL
jgi:hypothetical protein